MRLTGPYRPVRGLRIGKAFYVKERRGRLYACKWPVRRPRVKHPTTLAQMEKFRQANWLCKYAAPQVQVAHRRLVDGTQLLPRDMMIAAMYGRGFTWQVEGQRRLYPMAAIRDLSDNLDILGAITASVLVRKPEGWRAITPTLPGQTLVAQAAGEAPIWTIATGGTGIWAQIADVTLGAAIGLNVYQSIVIPAGYNELEFTLFVPAHATGTRPAMRVNGLSGANYFWSQLICSSAPVVSGGTFSGDTKFPLVGAVLPNITGRGFARGRIFQAAANDNAGVFCELSNGGIMLTNTNGNWTFGGSPTISTVSFASIGGVGLQAGTRIVVRGAKP